jgi:ATP-dependent Clp protease ATP-binding subunit ClpA
MSRTPVPFAPETLESIRRAFRLAADRRHDLVGLEHLLYALIEIRRRASPPSRRPTCRSWAAIDEVLSKSFSPVRGKKAVKPESTIGFDRVVERAVVHAASSSAQQVDSGALLVFLLQEDDSHASYFLRKQGVDRLTLLRLISHGGQPDPSTSGRRGEPAEEPQGPRDPLEAFATDLVERASKGQIDPLIGREQEVERMVQCSAAGGRTTRPRVSWGRKTAFAEGWP